MSAKTNEFLRATELTPAVEAEIEEMFRYSAWNEEQMQRGNKVRTALEAAAKVIVAAVPPGPSRTVALRKLTEARMDCNKSITFGGRY